jgi:peptidoglycan lytic transglycosylase
MTLRRAHLPMIPLLLALVAAEHRPAPSVQEGLASFYGRPFEGKKTASGERFDKDELTAAHPSYPGGTVLRVTNLENSRSVRVRVTDRGPVEGVIIDLSRAAARRLRFTDEGRARVRVEVLRPGKERK